MFPSLVPTSGLNASPRFGDRDLFNAPRSLASLAQRSAYTTSSFQSKVVESNTESSYNEHLYPVHDYFFGVQDLWAPSHNPVDPGTLAAAGQPMHHAPAQRNYNDIQLRQDWTTPVPSTVPCYSGSLQGGVLQSASNSYPVTAVLSTAWTPADALAPEILCNSESPGAPLAHVRATRQCTPVPGEWISHVHTSFAENTANLTVRRDISVGAPCAVPPNGYRKKQFPPNIARQFVLDGIPENNVYYLIQDNPGDYHWCPIGECGEYFLGHDIRTHLRDYHKNINSRSRDIIKCTVKSSESSKCSPGSEVQGRNFEKHFREVHVDHHFLCPFCQGRQKRVLQFKKHFRVCKSLWISENSF